MCTYQGVRNVSFSENVAYVRNTKHYQMSTTKSSYLINNNNDFKPNKIDYKRNVKIKPSLNISNIKEKLNFA